MSFHIVKSDNWLNELIGHSIMFAAIVHEMFWKDAEFYKTSMHSSRMRTASLGGGGSATYGSTYNGGGLSSHGIMGRQTSPRPLEQNDRCK